MWTFILTFEYGVHCTSILIPLLNALESPHAMLILFYNYLLLSCEICCEIDQKSSLAEAIAEINNDICGPCQ